MTQTTTRTDVRTGLIIGGETVQTDDTLAVHNPAAPAELVGHAASASQDHARAAVHSAHEAWRSWQALTPRARAETLVHSLGALDADRAERAELLVRENGKVLPEAQIELDVFVGRCILAANIFGELDNVRRLLPPAHDPTEVEVFAPAGDGRPPPPPVQSEVTMLSKGVVTIIVPYNWPLAILAASLPYALIAGNTVIVKPPPTTPLSMVRTLEHVARGLPPGVLNVVTGTNEAVAPLITDPLVRHLVFTGSTGAGRRMMVMAADNLTRITLELGGNDPAILCEDVDLDAAAIGRLVVGSFLTTGQVCMGIKRIYVHRSRFDELVDGMAEVLDGYRVGNGLDPATSMGPLNSERQRDFVAELCREASDAGAEVRELGTIAEDALAAGGWFLRPALVLDPDPGLRIVTDEQFGPAVPILPFDDVDPVIEHVNDDWAGLCSSVWTASDERARELSSRLRTGTVWVNNHNAVAQDDRAPFGGFRQSGIGRELGIEGLYELTEPRTVTWMA